jgi:superfamily II DNA or RNA helicase
MPGRSGSVGGNTEAIYMSEPQTRVPLTPYQAKYFAHELERSYANDHVGKIAGLLFDAQVEPKPHQIDAALFVLQSTYLNGVILADEVGLGKTIEAGIVITQYWAERRREILIIAPSSLRQQWKQELFEKFFISAEILDRQSRDSLLKRAANKSPHVLICSYEFARLNEAALTRKWDLVVADEAHRLRNYWTGKGKASIAVSHILSNAHKTLLLTATPLQNRLEELYGLVSTFDPSYFYSLDAFRERYVSGRGSKSGDDLAERVKTIAKRTLRRDADKYIQFTKRWPLTIEFEPSKDEQRLYSLVNEYLQRDELYAFAGSQRQLSALIIRKRLGSSTHAVASTLDNIASRLESEIESGQYRTSNGALVRFTTLDEDLTDEEREEAERLDSSDGVTEQAFGDRAGESELLEADLIEEMRDEVRELRSFGELARSIKINQKAARLVEALDLGFARLRELGAPEKAIIFTDSTKTQRYIEETLRAAGRGDGIVLFDGANMSPEQTAIYKQWLSSNENSDLVTGIAAVDRRKALVEYFRESGSVMIATEAAAEGINLQFCSMVVNYDLPWNPQRVEQRIGRAHRYGQKFDVVVVNFSNRGNLAERRILELLDQKFQLFSTVFGASDEVLGAIESGIDFEKAIADILGRSRTDAEIDAAFKELEQKYAGEIFTEMASARAKVFDNLDPNVQDRLKAYDAQSDEVLNKFERLLLGLTRHQLADYAEFDSDGRVFELVKPPTAETQLGRYFFKSQPIPNAHQYRFASPLGRYVIESSKFAVTPAARLTFSLQASDRVGATAKSLLGVAGVLTVRVVDFKMTARDETIEESYFLAGAVTLDGRWLDEEYVADLLQLGSVNSQLLPAELDETPFTQHLDGRLVSLQGEVQLRNSRYYNEQEDLLYRNDQDRLAEHEARIRQLRAKEKDARQRARNEDDPMQQLKCKQEARQWAARAEDADDEFRVVRKTMRQEADSYLQLVEQSLKGTSKVTPLFTVEFEVVA